MGMNWVVPAVLGVASILGGSKKANGVSKPKTPETEKTAGLIGMSRYQMAGGINNAQMPAAMNAATADHKQSLRGSANTQSMMGVTNPFMGLQGGSASAVSGTGVGSTLTALSEATNLARANRQQRLSSMGNVMNGDAGLANAGLTDLSSIASNASIRQLSRDIEMSNARKGAFMSLAGGAALGYMDRPDVVSNTPSVANYSSQQPGMNYGTSPWTQNSYQTRPFK